MKVKRKIAIIHPSLLMMPWLLQAILLAAQCSIIHRVAAALNASGKTNNVATARGLSSGVLTAEVYVIAGSVMAILLSLILVLYLTKLVTQKIAIIKENSLRLSRRLPLARPLGGSDEIAELDAAFHQMAASLERRYQGDFDMIENAVDLIAVLDKQGNFKRVNPAIGVLCGIDPDRLLSKPLGELIISPDLEAMKTAIVSLPSNFERVLDLRLKAGSGKIVDLVWSMRWNDDNQSVFCVAHDVTRVKNAERLRRELVQMATHDMRTPLTVITAAFEMIDASAISVDQNLRRVMQLAASSAQRMLILANDLLDMDRLESGRLMLIKAPVKAVLLFEQVSDSLEMWAASREISLRFLGDECTVVLDSTRIIQVLVNLVSNAIKFSPPGSTIDIDCRQRNAVVEFSVRDKGRGIPADMLGLVFERFNQVESCDRDFHHGCGLGLAICKALVELHDGEIGVHSVVGCGSTFWFALPLAPEEKDARTTAGHEDKADIPLPAIELADFTFPSGADLLDV